MENKNVTQEYDVVRFGRMGVVYFFTEQTGEDAPIKIGFTERDAATRLGDIVTMSPRPLKVAAHAPGTLGHERALHARFAAARLHGEWFSAVPELVDLVEHVVRAGELPEDVVPIEGIMAPRAATPLVIDVALCGPSCTFCGARRPERKMLFSAPKGAAYICNECADVAAAGWPQRELESAAQMLHSVKSMLQVAETILKQFPMHTPNANG